MRPLFYSMTLLAILLLPPSIAWTQTEKPEPPRQQQSGETSKKPTATGQAGTPDSTKSPTAPPASAKQLKEFKPTDKITADSAVSLPIDI